METVPVGGILPVRLSEMCALKPFTEFTVTKYGAPVPRLRVCANGLTVTVKSGVPAVIPVAAACCTGNTTNVITSARTSNGALTKDRIMGEI